MFQRKDTKGADRAHGYVQDGAGVQEHPGVVKKRRPAAFFLRADGQRLILLVAFGLPLFHEGLLRLLLRVSFGVV